MSAKEKSMEILIVEDSPTQAEQLKYLLEMNGYSITSAANGKEALSILRKYKPAMIISDIIMPEMDGYALSKEIKSDKELRDIPIILVTYLSNPQDVLKGLECGADNFITKPYEEKYLLSRVHYTLLNMELRESRKAGIGIEVSFAGETFFITAERQQILNLLLSTYETAVQKNHELINAQNELKEFNEQLEQKVKEQTIELMEEIKERKRAEKKIKEYTVTLEKKVKERTRELELRSQEAEVAKLQAMSASRAKSDFLANMSHELRTPLNTIIGLSEILYDELYGKLNEKQKKYVEYIAESGRHLLNLINDILDLSKVESGKMELEVSRLSLEDVLNISMPMLKEKAMRHSIKLSLDIKQDADIQIEADGRKLKQIMFNLLSNAVKFTPDGGSVSVQARLVNSEQYLVNSKKLFTDDYSLTTNRDFIEITVEDTGIGIKPEDMDKLFEEFSQLEIPYEKKYEGTGLGLALTKRLVELHGGGIWVESELGMGSKFTFAIPVTQAKRR